MAGDKQGKVYLVGAGPGDPGLLTIKARECLRHADVIVYDNLANQSFLDYADEKAELIYAGKKGGCHAMSQHEIDRTIKDKAMAGLMVVRLKGGDPFIFGRGGEEARELAEAGIPFDVVPGVTSAIAVPAYAGIPLTHRDYTSTVTFVTGHEDPTKDSSNIDWDRLANGPGTLVFLMGVGNLSRIADSLIKYGRSPKTPAAVIQRGTVSAQRTITGELRDIAEKAQTEDIRPPAVIVVGDVVNLRKELNWFEKSPLFGKRIMVTRAREQASDFLAGLSELGAECIEFPTIEIIPPISWKGLDEAIRSMERYQWVLFTSVNGVKFFFQRVEVIGKDARDLKGIKIGAIGPKTAQALHERGIRPDLVPDEYKAEAVVELFKNQKEKALRVLLPRAARAREVLPEELEKMGAQVNVVEAYRTVKPDNNKDMIREMLEKGEIHMVTFTSSSTVTNFVEMFESDSQGLGKWMADIAVACIGPVTARTAEENGLKVSLMPQEYTIEALTSAIVQYFLSQ
ncbi:MAG: uroporphyrinogen-III C-methyltransferase [Deltaproteobacteria bacterium]|nr:uroporphyrinogen-III C-methyltransferase [Deltaproteobacteria bacterium]